MPKICLLDSAPACSLFYDSCGLNAPPPFACTKVQNLKNCLLLLVAFSLVIARVVPLFMSSFAQKC